jgi:hypothetical protein
MGDSHELTPSKGGQPAVTLETGDTSKEFFCDGLTSLALGYPFSKLVLTSTDVNIKRKNEEVRREVVRLTVPTNTLLEIASLINNQANQGRDGLIEQCSKYTDTLKTQLANIKIETIPETKN